MRITTPPSPPWIERTDEKMDIAMKNMLLIMLREQKPGTDKTYLQLISETLLMIATDPYNPDATEAARLALTIGGLIES